MPKAICADRPGGIEVLDWREIETPHLGPVSYTHLTLPTKDSV